MPIKEPKRIKEIIRLHPYPFSVKEREDDVRLVQWIETVLEKFEESLEERMKDELEAKVDKVDIRLLIEKSDEKFAAIQREIAALRREIDIRFEAQQKEMNARFEAQQKEINARFEVQQQQILTLQKEMHTRFEAQQQQIASFQREMDKRFEALDKRFSFIQWFIGIGFSVLALLTHFSK